MKLNSNDMIQLAIDTTEGKVQGEFSADQAAKIGSDAIREAMIETFGTAKLDYKAFRRNGAAFFEFIEEVITPATHKKLEETFNRFAEVRSIPYGDQNKFLVPNTELFPAATIAEGSANIRRKRLEGSEFTVEISSVAIGIYEELVRFLAGRVDWPTYIQKLVDSFERDIAERISSALYGSFDKLGEVYKASVASDAADMKEKVLDIAAHVEAEHGSVVLVGTKAALRNLNPEYYSDGQAGARNQQGYFATVDGYDVIAMPQFHKSNTDEFAIDDKTILILPQPDEKIVKVVFEGEALVRETNGGETYREDMQVRFDVIQRVGVLIINPRKYGMVQFT